MNLNIAEGGGASVGVDDIVLLLKVGPGRALLEEALLRKIAAAMAERKGIGVADEDVQSRLNALYADQDLFEPAQIAAWLASVKVDETALRQYARELLLEERLAEVLVSDEAVQQRFDSSQFDYAMLHLQKIVVAGHGPARETLLQLHESEITWEQAAQRAGAMESLVLRRKDAPVEVAAELFVSSLGSVVGPVEEEVGSFAIFRLEWKVEPRLDDDLRQEIRAQLYEEELRAALADAPVRFLGC